MDWRADTRDPGSRQAETRSQIRHRALGVRLHDVRAAQRAGGGGRPPVLRVERPGSHSRSWLAPSVVRALEILLEVGQVAPRARVHGSQPARFLGATWVSRRSRPLERNPVLVAGAI